MYGTVLINIGRKRSLFQALWVDFFPLFCFAAAFFAYSASAAAAELHRKKKKYC
jgi:hypothetical protein